MTPAQLRRLRKHKGWSQDDLAEVLGVHPMTVSKWERGEQPMDKRTQIAIRCLAEHDG
jgi:transcriptional regulator with XRE-family HTH domain